MSLPDEAEIEASRAPLLEHLIELRRRLIVCAIALVIAFVVCFAISKDIYLLLLRPFEMATNLLAQEKSGHRGALDLVMAVTGLKEVHASNQALKLVFTAPLEFFFTKIKLAMFGAVVITFPILAWQLYRFVAPGLYRRERTAFLPFLLASPVLFALGASLVYFIMLPFVLWFSLSQQISSPEVQVQLLPKVSDYLDLVMRLLLAFGLCFQLPVVLALAGMAGLVQADTLSKGRRYAFVGIIVVSALVTPPDMVSPFLLAGPIYLLYEASIWCVRLIEARRRADERREAAST
ncbi:MAG TPA: twin-arginine translocase subunit TatC [Caulobacteraceae bacterium]